MPCDKFPSLSVSYYRFTFTSLRSTKENAKIYTHYTGYVGNQKVETPKKVRQKHPELLLERAIKGMIPHNKLGNAVYKKLNVYKGTVHPHEAQQPEKYEIV